MEIPPPQILVPKSIPPDWGVLYILIHCKLYLELLYTLVCLYVSIIILTFMRGPWALGLWPLDILFLSALSFNITPVWPY